MSNNLDRFCESLNSLDLAGNKDNLVALLYEITDLVQEEPDISPCYEAIFRFIEKCQDADIGSPGPLVHLIEKHYPGYVPDLLTSIQSKPTSSSVHMLNRILNSELSAEDRKRYLELLKLASENEEASEFAREDASDFYEFQLSKRA